MHRRFQTLFVILIVTGAIALWWWNLNRQKPVMDSREPSSAKPSTSAPVAPQPVAKNATTVASSKEAPALMPARVRYSEEPPNESRSPALSQLPRAGQMSLNGRKGFSVLPAKAVAEGKYQGPESEVIARVSGFVLVRKEKYSQKNPRIIDGERPVVWNQTKRRAEIVSGTLIVIFKPEADGQAFGRRHGLSVLSSSPSINTFYYSMPPGFPWSTAVQNLKKDPDVKTVEVELLGGGGAQPW